MGLTNLKKELKKLSQEELIHLIASLYSKNKSVKVFLDFYVNPKEEELHAEYRSKVYHAFFPKRGYQLKLQSAKKAISEFKNLGSSSDLVADLLLFYVETGIAFIREYGDIDQAFYSSMESTYSTALKTLEKEELLDKFEPRVRKIVTDTSGYEWMLENLAAIYYEFYNIYPDEIEE